MIEGWSPVLQSLLGTFFTWGLTAAGAALVFIFSDGQKQILDGSLGFAAGIHHNNMGEEEEDDEDEKEERWKYFLVDYEDDEDEKADDEEQKKVIVKPINEFPDQPPAPCSSATTPSAHLRPLAFLL